jgi:hypothetical protein
MNRSSIIVRTTTRQKLKKTGRKDQTYDDLINEPITLKTSKRKNSLEQQGHNFNGNFKMHCNNKWKKIIRCTKQELLLFEQRRIKVTVTAMFYRFSLLGYVHRIENEYQKQSYYTNAPHRARLRISGHNATPGGWEQLTGVRLPIDCIGGYV